MLFSNLLSIRWHKHVLVMQIMYTVILLYVQFYNMQEADALLGTFGGIENKFNSCWLISAIQLLNSTALHKFLFGESM